MKEGWIFLKLTKRTSQIRSSTYEKETNEEFRAEKKNHWVGSIEEWI